MLDGIDLMWYKGQRSLGDETSSFICNMEVLYQVMVSDRLFDRQHWGHYRVLGKKLKLITEEFTD